jgi:hypothetical protein
MKPSHLFCVLTFALVASGCVGTKAEHRFTHFAVTESDLARYKEIAIKSAEAPETWQHFQAQRIESGAVMLNTSKVEYRFDLDHPGLIQVFINSRKKSGMHSEYVAVTIDRNKDSVVGIEESVWP